MDESPNLPVSPAPEPVRNGHDSAALLAIFTSLDKTAEVRENYTRVPLGYPGNKTKSITQIIPHLPYRSTYCEPCGGTGAILFARHESPLEVYNDRYGGIVSFYRCMRDDTLWLKLRERIELTVHSREEFIWCKQTWEDVSDDVERAARWYYLNQNSFGQQGRNFGRAIKGKAQHGNALRNNLKLFAPAHFRLRNVQIENLDWRKCLTDYDNQDAVFYIDPTYVKFAKGAYTHNMTIDDHKEMIQRINHAKGFVAVSGYDDPETHEIYDKIEWDHFYKWRVHTSSVALAFSDTNNREGMDDDIKRHHVVEALWVKECI